MNFTVEGQEYLCERAVATQQTGFVLVAQLRRDLPDYVGAVLWFGVDDADMTVFSPMYCSITKQPESLRPGNGSMTEYSPTSAFWAHNIVSNMAYSKYDYMIKDIRKVQSKIEDNYRNNQPMVEKKAMEIAKADGEEAAIQYLTDYSADCANGATAEYHKLAQYLLVKYIDGNVKKEKNGKFLTENGLVVFPDQPGYSKEYYEAIHKGNYEQLKVPASNKKSH